MDYLEMSERIRTVLINYIDSGAEYENGIERGAVTTEQLLDLLSTVASELGYETTKRNAEYPSIADFTTIRCRIEFAKKEGK